MQENTTAKTYAEHFVTAERKEDSINSEFSADGFTYKKGAFIRNANVTESNAADFNAQSHNSGKRYYDAAEAGISVTTEPEVKTKKAK